MGPQPHGHGYVYDERFGYRWVAVSMGPQPLGHGYVVVWFKKRNHSEFQWGHNLSVMDTRCRRYQSSGAERVSMGPQPLGHGYDEDIKNIMELNLRFQWGHNLSVMDTGLFAWKV